MIKLMIWSLTYPEKRLPIKFYNCDRRNRGLRLKVIIKESSNTCPAKLQIPMDRWTPLIIQRWVLEEEVPRVQLSQPNFQHTRHKNYRCSVTNKPLQHQCAKGSKTNIKQLLKAKYIRISKLDHQRWAVIRLRSYKIRGEIQYILSRFMEDRILSTLQLVCQLLEGQFLQSEHNW